MNYITLPNYNYLFSTCMKAVQTSTVKVLTNFTIVSYLLVNILNKIFSLIFHCCQDLTIFFSNLMQISIVLLPFDDFFCHACKCGTIVNFVKTITVCKKKCTHRKLHSCSFKFELSMTT